MIVVAIIFFIVLMMSCEVIIVYIGKPYEYLP